METQQPLPAPTTPTATEYRGNSNDLIALLAATFGVATLATCILSWLAYCLPFALGVIGLLTAKEAVDPRRARRLSWLGIGAGGLIVLITLLCVLSYCALIFFAALFGTGPRVPRT